MIPRYTIEAFRTPYPGIHNQVESLMVSNNSYRYMHHISPSKQYKPSHRPALLFPFILPSFLPTYIYPPSYQPTNQTSTTHTIYHHHPTTNIKPLDHTPLYAHPTQPYPPNNAPGRNAATEALNPIPINRRIAGERAFLLN